MENLEIAEKFLEKLASNPFSVSPNYEVHIDIRRFSDNLGSYSQDAELALAQSASHREVLQAVTPAFQRDNDKWSIDMQRSFVENLLAGCKTTIQLFTLGAMNDCLILDGLQRSTAIADFQDGKFTVYDGYTYEQVSSRLATSRARVTFSVYTFASELEAVDFYIQMNENITHSAEDILKAKLYRETLIV